MRPCSRSGDAAHRTVVAGPIKLMLADDVDFDRIFSVVRCSVEAQKQFACLMARCGFPEGGCRELRAVWLGWTAHLNQQSPASSIQRARRCEQLSTLWRLR